MGVLADFFLANTDAIAAEYNSTNFPESDRAQWKRLTTVEMSTLWAAFERQPWDAKLLASFGDIAGDDDGDWHTSRLPERLVELLATSPADAFADVVRRWAATDEMNCQPAELGPLVGDLVRLARRARTEAKRLYLWNCV